MTSYQDGTLLRIQARPHNANQKLATCLWHPEHIKQTLTLQENAGGGAVVVTIAPVVCHSGVHFAALGLPHMLNGGAAVRASSLSSVDDLLQNSRTSR